MPEPRDPLLKVLIYDFLVFTAQTANRMQARVLGMSLAGADPRIWSPGGRLGRRARRSNGLR